MSTFALSGLKVLDFSWVGVGPITTKYLADNGADVIKIESATHIDVLRLGPPWKEIPGVNRSQFFASFNTSKKSATINMEHPKGVELVRRMVPWADVVVENFTPKVMQNWKLDYEQLRSINPEIIMMSTCLQGHDGPRSDAPGYGQLLSGLAGFNFICGYPDSEPCPPYGAYTDFAVPRLALCVLLAALDYRRRTGKGQFIDVSQYEAALHFMAPALVDYFASGRIMSAHGNRDGLDAPHGAYRCRDEGGGERWISIAVEGDDNWRALLGVLGNPRCDQRFSSREGRLQNSSQLDDFIAVHLRDEEAWDLTRRLQAAGIAAYPVQNCADLHRDENLDAFKFWNSLEHKEMGWMTYEGLQHRLSATPGELRWAAPTLGQHTDEILAGFGFSSVEIAQLREEGVLL